MALELLTKSPTFDITMQIDDEPVRLHVARLTRAALITFRADAAKHEPRGIAEESDEQRAQRQLLAREFTERCIREYVTFEPGDVMADLQDGDASVPVVTGAQIVQVFYNRMDVLDALASAVYAENCLGKHQKKVLKSSRTFSPGSTPSTPTPAGAAPVSTAVRVDENVSVSAAGVMVDRAVRPSGNSAG